jgi:hypothetical protein
MNTRCESCGATPITHRCAGLDTPWLDFCPPCAAKHEMECPMILAGNARIVAVENVGRGEEEK